MRRSGRLAVGIVLFTAGCAARGPAVSTEGTLALRRVVVYRNGVGYFERRGHVARDQVEFRVRQSEVGDFLATLAVMEQGGSSVRSAAFPMPADDDGSAGGEQPAPRRPAPEVRRSVRLRLDGQHHDLVVGYMIETPIWRPSYRLVFNAQGVQVQAWGIVQNLSGEDWNDVRLSLVSGAPVTFRSELAEPVISPRPLVTDRGEVIDAVPRGDTTLAQSAPAPSAEPAPTVPAVSGAPVEEPSDGDANAERSRSGGAGFGRNHAAQVPRRMAPPAAPRYYPSRPTATTTGYGGVPYGGAPVPDGPSPPRTVAILAAVARQGGTTRYDLPAPVTVPDHSATMVMLAVRDVPGQRMYLFAPDPGVGDSAVHPFQVARFENRTGALLERGPLAIFEAGAFLGQGMLDPLPDGATATVPFSLERGIVVESQNTSAVEGARLLRLAHGEITLERYNVQRTTYRVRNGMDAATRVVLRHTLTGEMRLHEPPAGTEQANGAALVPLETPRRGSAEVTVQTRVPFAQQTQWIDELVAEAVETYLRTGNPTAADATALRAALDLRRQLIDQARQRAVLEERRRDLMVNSEETRGNLEAIRRNPAAADLRARLTSRLALVSGQIDDATRRIVELDTSMGERRIRLVETVRDLGIDTSAATPRAR